MSDATRQYVLFRVGDEAYGLPIANVSSIIRYEPTTPVPRAPRSVDGVIDLRGRVVPVVDLAKRLFGTTTEPDATTRIVVTEGEGGEVGLIVDQAMEVATLSSEEMMPPPASALRSDVADAFQAVVHRGDRLVILLDLDRVLPRAEYEVSSAVDPEGDA